MPAAQALQYGVAVDVHDPDMYRPASQLVTQDVHAAWVPAEGAYVPALHVMHTGVAVIVQDPLR